MCVIRYTLCLFMPVGVTCFVSLNLLLVHVLLFYLLFQQSQMRIIWSRGTNARAQMWQMSMTKLGSLLKRVISCTSHCASSGRLSNGIHTQTGWHSGKFPGKSE
jgi:hypothetical protein